MALGLRVGIRTFVKSLVHEVQEDNVANGAAALAYYLLLSLVPAMIFLLTLIPYLPIENLHEAVMNFVRQALPGEASNMVEKVIAEVTLNKRQGLLSFGLLATVWAASSGLYAVMQQLNITYGVKESRPFWKVRGIAIGLTLLFGLLVVGSFALIVFGGVLQNWLGGWLAMTSWGASPEAREVLLFAFSAFRWIVIALLLLMAFALTYYFGPDVEQRFRFISPGSVMGVVVLALASLVFRIYVTHFGNYAATYGSLGAVIILMLWLYIAGLVILFGSEVNALAEHFAHEGKVKGEHVEGEKPRAAAGVRGEPAQVKVRPVEVMPPSWQGKPAPAALKGSIAFGLIALVFAAASKSRE
jgi:membrane protein